MAFASQVSAQNCPDFFRFVDFGIVGHDGVMYRGGATFRAESLSGSPLLLREETKCLPVNDIASDGHGNPIPVVRSVTYNPSRTGMDLGSLQVTAIKDTQTFAEMNAAKHLKRLNKSNLIITRGENFLCATSSTPAEISCQLVSPYPNNIALVIYCDDLKCTMPALALTDTLAAVATWTSPHGTLKSPEVTARAISDKVMKIHDFLKPLSSIL